MKYDFFFHKMGICSKNWLRCLGSFEREQGTHKLERAVFSCPTHPYKLKVLAHDRINRKNAAGYFSSQL